MKWPFHCALYIRKRSEATKNKNTHYAVSWKAFTLNAHQFHGKWNCKSNFANQWMSAIKTARRRGWTLNGNAFCVNYRKWKSRKLRKSEWRKTKAPKSKEKKNGQIKFHLIIKLCKFSICLSFRVCKQVGANSSREKKTQMAIIFIFAIISFGRVHLPFLL